MIKKTVQFLKKQLNFFTRKLDVFINSFLVCQSLTCSCNFLSVLEVSFLKQLSDLNGNTCLEDCLFLTQRFIKMIKLILQKQPPRGVLWKRCSENMQKIYRRTPMSKYDFNKAALQLYWNYTSAWVFSCKFAAYFQNTFS